MAFAMHISLVSLIFMCISSQTTATRVKFSEPVVKFYSADYIVDLWVTRHALSCANIVSDWKGSQFLGPVHNRSSVAARVAPQRSIPDPILAGAGAQGSMNMGAYIKDHQMDEPDAVLSSELVRAIETALLQYPGKPVNVVPWLREGGFKKLVGEGLDNLPSPQPLQIEHLQMALADIPSYSGSVLTLEDKWMHGLHGEKGNWTMFVEFLGNTFLPQLLPQLGKPKGSRITLAVVTHSLFMSKTPDIEEHCGQYWAENKKPFNNQAVKITYSAFDKNSTGRGYGLVQHGGCSLIAPGLSYKDSEICLRDIGQACTILAAEAMVSLPTTLEDKLSAVEEKVSALASKISDIKKSLSGLPEVTYETMPTPESSRRHRGLFKVKKSPSEEVAKQRQRLESQLGKQRKKLTKRAQELETLQLTTCIDQKLLVS